MAKGIAIFSSALVAMALTLWLAHVERRVEIVALESVNGFASNDFKPSAQDALIETGEILAVSRCLDDKSSLVYVVKRKGGAEFRIIDIDKFQRKSFRLWERLSLPVSWGCPFLD